MTEELPRTTARDGARILVISLLVWGGLMGVFLGFGHWLANTLHGAPH